jgi:hypothetical protein
LEELDAPIEPEAEVPAGHELVAEAASEPGTPVLSEPPAESAAELPAPSPWAAAVAGTDAFESDIRL